MTEDNTRFPESTISHSSGPDEDNMYVVESFIPKSEILDWFKRCIADFPTPYMFFSSLPVHDGDVSYSEVKVPDYDDWVRWRDKWFTQFKEDSLNENT